MAWSSETYRLRRERARERLVAAGVDALLVTSELHVRYLTGFTGDSSWLWLAEPEPILFSDSRFATQIEEECPGLAPRIRTQRTKLVELLAGELRSFDGRLGWEVDHLTLGTAGEIRQAVGREFQGVQGVVESLRVIKEEGEIAALRQAVSWAESAFLTLRKALRPDMTERQAARLLETTLWELGSDGLSFPAIVATGDRAALPHYRAAERTIGTDGVLLIDWGAIGPDGYCSDLTRTLLRGGSPPELERAYEAVLGANEAALAMMRPGVTCAAADAAARNVIEAAGFGERFGHGLGHGIGLAVHESPRLSSLSVATLLPGMVVTVEPGIYLPGVGGIRIEEDVLVTETGCETLSRLPRDQRG